MPPMPSLMGTVPGLIGSVVEIQILIKLYDTRKINSWWYNKEIYNN